MSADILVPQSVSPDCKDLILKLCDRNPETRISIHDALMHPFIQQCAQAKEELLAQSPRGRSESLPLPPLPGRKIRCIPENSPYKNDNITHILAMCHRKPPKNVKSTTAASIIIPTHILPIARNSSSTSLVVNRLKCRNTSSLLIGGGNNLGWNMLLRIKHMIENDYTLDLYMSVIFVCLLVIIVRTVVFNNVKFYFLTLV